MERANGSKFVLVCSNSTNTATQHMDWYDAMMVVLCHLDYLGLTTKKNRENS